MNAPAIENQSEGAWPQHFPARVTHARRGDVSHSFSYAVDYLLLDPESSRRPLLLKLDRFGLVSFNQRDHGGARGKGQGAVWARKVLSEAGLADQDGVVLRLLTQPRFLGVWFTPVSFWIALRDDQIIAFIAEVNNTFGQRHCYLCHDDGFAPLDGTCELSAAKAFHVSPFQDVSGDYRFRVRLDAGKLTLRIRHTHDKGGLVATMVGPLRPLTNARLLASAVRRPFWPLRVLSLIHWHALRLWLKGAAYRPVPTPPDREISQ